MLLCVYVCVYRFVYVLYYWIIVNYDYNHIYYSFLFNLI